jgi:hypothetical protein
MSPFETNVLVPGSTGVFYRKPADFRFVTRLMAFRAGIHNLMLEFILFGSASIVSYTVPSIAILSKVP